MLEDDFNDALGKAVRGTGLTPAELGIDSSLLRSLMAGEMDESAIRKIAPKLNLNAQKLIHLDEYNPSVIAPENLHTFTSDFGHLGVNAYVYETENHLLVFDTGTDAEECLNFLSSIADKTVHLFITHDHPDHIARISDFNDAKQYSKVQLQGETICFDHITVTGLDVAGHYSPATAYLIKTDTLVPVEIPPICIVGDAILAGSIGKCYSQGAYLTALSNIRENILRLARETILCPGHGPLTTVQNELVHNPFF